MKVVHGRFLGRKHDDESGTKTKWIELQRAWVFVLVIKVQIELRESGIYA